MKKLIATITILGITCATSQAWYGGGSGWGNGYGGASGTCGGGGYRGYNSVPYGYGGGCGGGGWGGYGGYPNSSSFGNQYGQWGNGQGATLSAIAQIVGAAVPILAPRPVMPPPQPMPYYPSGYIAPRPVIVY